jgi:hypothetical protein
MAQEDEHKDAIRAYKALKTVIFAEKHNEGRMQILRAAADELRNIATEQFGNNFETIITRMA